MSMIKIENLFFILSFLVSFSCSHISSTNDASSFASGSGMSVNDEMSSESQNDVNESNSFVDSKETKIDMLYDNSNIAGVGPNPLNGQNDNGNGSGIVSEKNPIVALVFSPGIYRVLDNIKMLKALLKNETSGNLGVINIQITSGIGMGAIISTLFAANYTPEKMEWFFYKLFKDLDDVSPFTKQWGEIILKNLVKEIKFKNIQDLPRMLMLPLYDNQQKKIVLVKRGNIEKVLSYHLVIDTTSLADKGEDSRFSSPVKYFNFSPTLIRKSGADIVVSSNVLSAPNSFFSGNGLLVGVFARVSEIIKKQTSLYNYTIEHNNASGDMDNASDLKWMNRGVQNEFEKDRENILKIIQIWKSKAKAEI